MSVIGNLLDRTERVFRRYRWKTFRDRFPSKGYEEQRNETKFVDLLKDSDLVELNNILDWNCFTVDCVGRRFGNVAWQGKRSEPEVIPDRRIQLLHDPVIYQVHGQIIGRVVPVNRNRTGTAVLCDVGMVTRHPKSDGHELAVLQRLDLQGVADAVALLFFARPFSRAG